MLAEKKQLEDELQKAIARNETVLKLYEKVYEDNATGKVTDEFFMQLSHRYEVERMELKNKISDLRRQLAEMGACELGRDRFLAAVRKFMQMDTLTAPLLRGMSRPRARVRPARAASRGRSLAPRRRGRQSARKARGEQGVAWQLRRILWAHCSKNKACPDLRKRLEVVTMCRTKLRWKHSDADT